MLNVRLTNQEARSALDVLDTVTAYTADELRDQFGWGKREVDAWAEATAKVRTALTQAVRPTTRAGR
jgi:hypothetical protein